MYYERQLDFHYISVNATPREYKIKVMVLKL